MRSTFDTTRGGLTALLLHWRDEGRRLDKEREMAALGYSQADIREEREREERCKLTQTAED